MYVISKRPLSILELDRAHIVWIVNRSSNHLCSLILIKKRLAYSMSLMAETMTKNGIV